MPVAFIRFISDANRIATTCKGAVLHDGIVDTLVSAAQRTGFAQGRL
jgi:hypothetical protein